MVIGSALNIDDGRIAEFCRRHNIRRLAVFGSALRDDFGPESDVDLLVEFEPGATPGMIRLAGMERELEHLVGGREVELRTINDLSRYFRDEVRSTSVSIYDAAA
jgi:uncharacterized protein